MRAAAAPSPIPNFSVATPAEATHCIKGRGGRRSASRGLPSPPIHSSGHFTTLYHVDISQLVNISASPDRSVRMPPTHQGQHSRPSVLYESQDKSIVILDIPRTIEESQVLSGRPPLRRIYSAQPVTEPFDTPEPKDGDDPGLQNKSPATQVAELMTAATVQSALQHLSSFYSGPFHLPRLVADAGDPSIAAAPPFIPEAAEYLHGSLQDTSQRLCGSAPAFDLMILDPPWPNRSARRKANSYATVSNLFDMHALLEHVPVSSHLKPAGLVAVWITNRSSILDFMTAASGLFASWGLELVAEWNWVKVTAFGEPIYDVDSVWRKPWEKLLIAKRIGVPTPAGLGSKTILAVPDLHSRKPNLRGLFEDILGSNFRCLEVFARNLTAGWWCWGNEVLHFQEPQHWVLPNSKDPT